MTRLEKALKREISIDNEPYVVTITPEGVTLTAKGKRKGPSLTWKSLLSGEAALTSALGESLKSGEA